MRKKPVLLCVLDGWGIGDEASSHNAIAVADLKNYKNILAKYPHSTLETSGLAVGLPEGQIGNSEVGHSTIGSGRVIFQDLVRINKSIADGSLEKNEKLQRLVSDLKNTDKICHIAGLFSDGGVHAQLDHIIFLVNFLEKNNVKTLLHIFLDGRDVAQKSALKFLEIFSAKTKNAKIATISGRYYAMDRDNNWNRVKLSCDAIIDAKSDEEKFDAAKDAVEKSYEKNITDEFVKPCISSTYKGMKDGDAFLFCNFRADRARQISTALLDKDFKEFERRSIHFSHAIAMVEYSDRLNEFYEILFEQGEIKNSLPEILEERGLTQLRIAETEKYAHVTFFFSCGREKEFKGEERIMIKSPAVPTYDLLPEMSSSEVGAKLIDAIKSDKFDFIVVNYANPDMVGHSGNLEASVKACRAIDHQLAILEKTILEKNGLMLITADHGNIECMRDENNQPHTSHTINLVPFILVGNDVGSLKLKDGNLSDVAPTILDLMNIEKPREMDGKSLLAKKNYLPRFFSKYFK